VKEKYSKCGLRVIIFIFVIVHLSIKVKIYADKYISFDGDQSRVNRFVCERVYLA
jgi:hypothetical protein